MKRDVRIIWSDNIHQSSGLVTCEDILQRAVKFVEDDERIVNIELIAEGVTSRFWIYVEKIEIGGKNM